MAAEQKPLVAFLGPRASYTHQAALDSFDETTHTLHPSLTISDVFSAVQSGHAHRGIVPFENSTNGSVVFTLDLFADLENRYPDILVCGEAYVRVRHCLLGHSRKSHASSTKQALRDPTDSPSTSGNATPTTTTPQPKEPRTKPLEDLGHVKKIYSHPQAWGQCGAFLGKYLRGVERLDVSSTSKAAEVVARDEEGVCAAVSSEIAGRVHGVGVLARGIEDRGDNCTRFLILRKAQTGSGDGQGTMDEGVEESEEEIARFKTLISFTVQEDDPGALADSLAVFKPYKLNLTSINSRPSGSAPWHYIFFIEIRGRRREGGKGAVNQALKDLGSTAKGWRWLGSWENKLVK